ncbi:MAG: hypothetical protein V1696_03435 [Candidatus Jorgensenbacteria bacterium]
MLLFQLWEGTKAANLIENGIPERRKISRELSFLQGHALQYASNAGMRFSMSGYWAYTAGLPGMFLQIQLLQEYNGYNLKT